MAKMQKLLIATTVCLVLLVALAEANCKILLYRSPDMSALKLFMNSKKHIYLNLVDNSDDSPAIMFYVRKDRVYVFDKQARPQLKSLDTLLTDQDDIVSRQFQDYETQFSDLEMAAKLRGSSVTLYDLFGRSRFDIEWLPHEEYNVKLADVPNFGLQFKSGTIRRRTKYTLKSPLFDMVSHIDAICRVRVFQQGTEINLARLEPIERPHRSANNWNPMDPNSWTLIDSQAGSSSSSRGFQFARPLEPTEPEDPAEPRPLGGRLLT